MYRAEKSCETFHINQSCSESYFHAIILFSSITGMFLGMLPGDLTSLVSAKDTTASSAVKKRSTKIYVKYCFFCFSLQAKYEANRKKNELPLHTKHEHVNNVANNHRHYHLV